MELYNPTALTSELIHKTAGGVPLATGVPDGPGHVSGSLLLSEVQRVWRAKSQE